SQETNLLGRQATCEALERHRKRRRAVSRPLSEPSWSAVSSSSSSTSLSPFSEESSSPVDEDTSTSDTLLESESLTDSESLIESEPLFTYTLDEKVDELVRFLLLKYQAKQPVTKAEMVTNVISRYRGYFPMIFRKAREFIEILFGISLREVDPDGSYIFGNTLELSCEGGLSDEQGMPPNRLLILILSIIFMKGTCASEEVIWDVLSGIGVRAGREHFIFGEPRELLTKVWVQERYLEYREVPNTAPPRYEFLWGPRAHSEISKRSSRVFGHAQQYRPYFLSTLVQGCFERCGRESPGHN
ncbi:LOW QUALITY PROTEIN: melanoma-associated antigen C1-like, partial [Piliocolobus tephrosceles]|uniref:LOW QUALITY PROTEIN: melanoma-associated antigen C1-like n=1 Tax=Piliocolobus tephrosceles TaxID=591936 RepID=UPI000E6B01A8